MNLRWRALDVPLRGGHFSISGSRVTAARTIVVRLDAERDAGHGEAVPSARVMGQDEAHVAQRLEAARARLVQARIDPEGPPPPSPLQGESGAAACGVDGALLDLWARLRGEPLWRALGLPRAEKPTTSTISLDTPEAMAAEARRHTAAGFTHLKVKLGEAPARDRTRIEAVREAVPRAVLRVDGNEGWTPDDAAAMLPTLAACGVEFVEQPLRREVAHEALRDLTARCADHGVLHVLDEAVHGAADAVRIGDHKLAHGINVKLQKAGGLRPAVAALQAAHDRGLKVLVGCFVETWAGIGLAMQLAGAADWVDLDGAWLLGEEPFVPRAQAFLAGGVLRAGDGPGLGIAESVPLFR